MIKLAYRDNNWTPVIFCIKEMARRHYGVDVHVVHIQDEAEYEASLFNGAADILIEHHEFLFAEAARGARVTMFCGAGHPGRHQLGRPTCGRVAQRAEGRAHRGPSPRSPAHGQDVPSVSRAARLGRDRASA